MEAIMEEKIDEYLDYYNVKLSLYIVTEKEFEEKDSFTNKNILKEGVSIKNG